MAKNIALLFLTILLAVGCKTAMNVPADTSSIRLKENYVRTSRGVNRIEIPAGIYEADFQTDQGIYYRSARKLINHSLGMTSVMRGGLFIPFPSQKDQRQGVWADHQEGSGGLIGFAASSNKRVFRFDEPVVFEEEK